VAWFLKVHIVNLGLSHEDMSFTIVVCLLNVLELVYSQEVNLLS